MPILVFTCRFTKHTSIFKTMGDPAQKNLFIPEFLKLYGNFWSKNTLKNPFHLGFLHLGFHLGLLSSRVYQLIKEPVGSVTEFVFQKTSFPMLHIPVPRAAIYNSEYWLPFRLYLCVWRPLELHHIGPMDCVPPSPCLTSLNPEVCSIQTVSIPYVRQEKISLNISLEK